MDLVKEQIDKWNTTESPETDSHKYSSISFDKGAKAMLYIGERTVFLTVLGTTGHPHVKRQ